MDPWAEHREFASAHAICNSGGAKFYKVDFHFHTPASGKDYKDGAASYDQIAERLRQERYDGVFVTDHNAWEGVNQLDEACKRAGGTTKVFAGAELTLTTEAICLLSEGKKISIVKFHCLALLPPSRDVEGKLRSLVTDNFKNDAILEKKPVDRVLRQPLEEVSRLVRDDWGGIFLPAHLHQSKGIEKSRSIDDLYEDSITIEYLKTHFDAVEIRKPENAKIFSGAFKTPDGLLVPEMTCVLGSDSHDLASVGREATWVLCDDLDFGQVREAMKHRDRVRFDEPRYEYPKLVCLNIDGAFLGKQSIRFSQSVTAFIGSKGSGKTGVLELARFALGYASGVDANYLAHLLGPGGRVSLSVEGQSGDQFLFVRSAADPGPHVFSEDGTPLDRATVVPTAISAEIRGWGETTKLAVDVDEQLRLLDNFESGGVIRAATAEIARARAQAVQIYRELRTSVTKYREIRNQTERLTLREATLHKLDAGRFAEDQAAKEIRDSEMAALNHLSEQLTNHLAGFRTQIVTKPIEALLLSLTTKQFAVAPEQRQAIDQASRALGAAQQRLDADARASLTSLSESLRSCAERVAASSAPLDEEYQRKFAALSVDEQMVLAKRNQVVQEISELEALRLQQDDMWGLVHAKLKELSAALGTMSAKTTERSDMRRSLVDQINETLERRGVGTRLQFNALARTAGQLPPGASAATAFSVLAAKFDALDQTAVIRDIGLTSLLDGPPSELEFSIDDDTSVKFEIYPGSWKSSKELSAGQKCTAVLPLLLVTAHGPIILDQPEDNLDNKYIGSAVVKMIQDRKQVSQLIITSHSASIVVMADCELIIEMEDDGNRGKAKTVGFLSGPDSNIAVSVLDILDGGRQALLARFKKYGRLVGEGIGT